MPSKRASRIFGAGDGDQFRFLQRLPWEKIVIWTLFVLGIWFLRRFFAAIFLTFIFGYIGHRVVRWICHKLGHDEPASKTWRATLIGTWLGFAAVVAGVGYYVAPRIRDQGLEFHQKVFGDAVSTPRAPVRPVEGGEVPPEPAVTADQLETVARKLLPVDWVPAPGHRHYPRFRQAIEKMAEFASASTADWPIGVANAAAAMLAFLLSVFVAYIFAFLILWDLPKLGQKVQSLGESNLGRIYHEIAPGMIAFGGGMGQAFQAQTLIALLNTFLTLIGLTLLGIPMKDVLSLVVFLCSFVPVLGVIISTIPIALVALAQVGPTTMLLAIGLVLVIHFIEAYILNPRIYGHVMHMHPLIVLVILFIAESLFGLWGVILGVPTCQFVFNYWIKRAKEKEAAAAADVGSA